MRLTVEHLAEKLDAEQLSVATLLRGPVCVLAGAGTGKTRAITHRIAYAVHSGTLRAENILALTFTVRAAGEMRARLADLGVIGVQAQTFHAAALAQLREFWGNAVGGNLPPIAESKQPLVLAAVARLGLPEDKDTIYDLAAEIEWLKVSLIAPQDYEARIKTLKREVPGGIKASDFVRLWEVYEEVKTERGVIDFEDVLLLLIGILRERPDIARTIRAKYRYFVVDEFQDVSPMQYRLLQLWLGNSKELCVVGDVSQTIYSFAGASSVFLADFTKYFPRSTKLVLQRNYRSTPQILDLANAVIAAGKDEATVTLKAQRPVGAGVTWQIYDDDMAEAEKVVAQIWQAHKAGRSLADFAILLRINAQSALYEQALQKMQIPYQIKGSERFFTRPAVREALALLRGSTKVVEQLELPELVESIFYSIGWRPNPPETMGAGHERWQLLQVLVNLAREMWENRRATIYDFVAELEERARYDNAPQMEAVTISTLHSAKGLEWPVVFLPGMYEGMMPFNFADTAEKQAEERRLLYVGITRAKDELHISFAKYNREGMARQASPFFAGLWPAPVSLSTLKRRRAQQAIADFAQLPQGEQRLYSALVAWRAQVAENAGKPAFQIFSDSVLREIAVHKPCTLPDLQAIKGIGQTKLSHYGLAVLQVVTDFINNA